MAAGIGIRMEATGKKWVIGTEATYSKKGLAYEWKRPAKRDRYTSGGDAPKKVYEVKRPTKLGSAYEWKRPANKGIEPNQYNNNEMQAIEDKWADWKL